MNLSVTRSWSVGVSDGCVARTHISYIWSVVRVSNRSVVLSVRRCSYKAQIDCWSGKRHIEWSVNEVRIPNIDVACVVSIMPVHIVIHLEATNLTNSTVSVVDKHITDLTYSTVVIVVYRNVLYLNNRPEVVILNIRVVIVS